MKSSEFFAFEDLPNESFKEFKTPGSSKVGLECVACGELWCRHIKRAMITHADQEFVWHGDWETKNIDIPMFPTQNIWARASLSKLEAGYARLLYVQLDPVEYIDISYLHPGEGRNVIRTTFIDYMLGDRLKNNKGGICHSPSHKFREETLWKERTKPTNKNRVVEYWSVWATGSCTACQFNTSASFDPDLIPEDKKESIW